jgi:DNA-binding transcriptional MerR regulator
VKGKKEAHMGRYSTGQPLDVGRFRRIIALRQAGCTLEQIGQRLGISRQAVHSHLRYWSKRHAPRCRECERALDAPGAARHYDRLAYCQRCLVRHPEATLGERLLALRLAAGLTRLELSQRTGVSQSVIHRYEITGRSGKLTIWRKLAGALPRLRPFIGGGRAKATGT